jgi:hypothetical protein
MYIISSYFYVPPENAAIYKEVKQNMCIISSYFYVPPENAAILVQKVMS